MCRSRCESMGFLVTCDTFESKARGVNGNLDLFKIVFSTQEALSVPSKCSDWGLANHFKQGSLFLPSTPGLTWLKHGLGHSPHLVANTTSQMRELLAQEPVFPFPSLHDVESRRSVKASLISPRETCRNAHTCLFVMLKKNQTQCEIKTSLALIWGCCSSHYASDDWCGACASRRPMKKLASNFYFSCVLWGFKQELQLMGGCRQIFLKTVKIHAFKRWFETINYWMLLRMKSEGRIYVPRQPGKSGIRFIWCLFGHLCLNRMWKHILICDCATSIPISLHVHLCLTGGRFALFPCSSSV